MATLEITTKNFEATVGKPGIVLIDFWASWCAPCRAFAPVFEAASAEHGDIVFGKIDTEAEQELAATFEIRSIPSVMIARDGVVLGMIPGALRAPDLASVIAQVRALDMNDVREKLAQEEKAHVPTE